LLQRQRVGPPACEVRGVEVDSRECLAHRVRLRRGRFVDRDPGEEFDQRHRLAGDEAKRRPFAVVNRPRHRAAPRREVVEQAEEERQVTDFDPRFVHRQDVATPRTIRTRGLDQPVRIGHALGDALGRNQLADVVLRDQRGQPGGGKRGVDRHGRLSRSAAGAA
jgi:hypothetical protein